MSFPDSPQQDRLEKVLAEHLERLDRGEAVDHEQLLAQYPELAEELQSYFAGADEVERLARAGQRGLTTWSLRGRTPSGEPAEAEPAIGTHHSPLTTHPFTGDYELLEQIGQGGMGVIYKARQRSLRRLVALKMIRADRLASLADRLRFRSEAEAVASLDHPHIVPIYEVGEHEGQPFFSMKLIEGGSLARRLPALAGDPRAASSLLATVARAVHYAHQRGLLHRDLKPGNILLDAQGSPHVSDFGLAKRLGPALGEATLTEHGAIVGTPNYMAPEQAANRGGVSTATDVYSLGAILYELLTGQPPFDAETPLETLRQLLEQNPVPPRSLKRRVDRDLETICLKCLQKEPHQRYRSAEALADDLERWLRGEPIRARPISRPRRALKWARRRPHLAALAALLALALVAGFAGVSWQWRRAEGAFHEAADLAEAQGRTAYARAISLAYARWLAGNAGAADQILLDTDAKLRGWEWHYLRRLFRARQLATLHGHEDGVLAVAFSPDGTRVASGDAQGVVKVWDRRVSREVLTLPGHQGAVSAVAFSPDGMYLASGGADGAVRVRNAATGEELATFRAHAGGVTGLAFDPIPLAGGNRPTWRLASTGHAGEAEPSGELKLWDATSGKTVGGRARDYLLSAVAYSPDGKFLATTGKGGDVTGWDARALEPVLRFASYTKGTELVFPSPNCVAFSADGSFVAAGSPDGLVRVWDAATSQECFSTLARGQASVFGLAFAGSDGRIITAATGDNTIQAWFTRGRKHAFTLRGHTRAVKAVACSPDGKCMASGSLDRTVKLWDLRQRDDDPTLRSPNQHITSVAFTADGARLASATRDRALRVWDVATGKAVLILKSLPEAVNCLAFSPDGSQLACAGADGTVRLRSTALGDAAVGGQVAALRPLQGHAGTALAVAFHPDGATLASAGVDGTVRLWEVASGREALRLRAGGATAVHSLAFSPDGTRLAAAGDDGALRVWETATAQEALVLKGHGAPLQPLFAVAFSPDGRRLATAGKDEVVRIWDTTTGNLIRTLHGHAGAVRGLAYGTGGRLASAGDDWAVRVWDAAGQELLALQGHTETLRAVAFSPDGNRLASAGDDGTIKFWDGTPLQEP
jgi:WD40 repeat protein/tRNA A-37 threonylcarbamoyl transferase component Bud32